MKTLLTTLKPNPSIRSIDLFLVDTCVEVATKEDRGNLNWDYMLGVTKRNRLVIVIPSGDGTFLTSNFNRKPYNRVYNVNWIG